MNSNNRYSIIPLAWPDTYVSGVGEWYERFLIFIGVIKNPIYKVGHAAFLIHDSTTREFQYYDFGRYETKQGFGRIRNAETDPELLLNSLKGKNTQQVLEVLSNMRATHGDGKILAIEILDVDTRRLKDFLDKYSKNKVQIYSPYRFYTLNCSRFVNAAVANSVSSPVHRLLLKLLPVKYLLTGTYLKFLSYLFGQRLFVQEATKTPPVFKQKETLGLTRSMKSKGYHLLQGIGSSSWFSLSSVGQGLYRIVRKDDKGETTFDFNYTLTGNQGFDVHLPFEFSYPSDALECNVIQNDKNFTFSKMQTTINANQSPKEIPKARAVSIR